MSESEEYVHNKDLDLADNLVDVASLLKTLRLNHGYTIPQLAKAVNLPLWHISEVENGKRDLPSENILRLWLNKLGCGRVNTQKVILAARNYRIKHWVTLRKSDSSNTDLLRLLEAYRTGKLSDFDRALLQLLAR